MERLLLATFLVIGTGCTSPEPGALETLAAGGGLYTEGLPAIVSQCGTIQPGFVAGDPTATPPVPDTLHGQPYDRYADTFCSVAWTYHLFQRDGSIYDEEWIYVVGMGTPDPALLAAAPPHIQAYANAGAGQSALYCRFLWRADRIEPVGTFSEHDVQLVSWTLEDVSHWCSADYRPGRYCAESSTSRCAPVDTRDSYVYRSSDPTVVIWKDHALEPDPLFRGFLGLAEGGAPRAGEPGGTSEAFPSCDAPTPSGDGMGPGYCLPCRLFSGTNEIPRCDWAADISALPGNSSLVDPAWRSAYPETYARVYGGR